MAPPKNPGLTYVYYRFRLTRLIDDNERQSIERLINEIRCVEVIGWIDETLIHVKIHGTDREGGLQAKVRMILEQFNAYS